MALIISYICHPISGNVPANVAMVKAIMTEIVRTEPDVLPFAPYLTALDILDDNDPEQRARGTSWNRVLLKQSAIDELRLYGDRVSPGMQQEVEWAEEQCLAMRPKIKGMTDATRRWLDNRGATACSCDGECPAAEGVPSRATDYEQREEAGWYGAQDPDEPYPEW